jgi:hypothetical protein
MSDMKTWRERHERFVALLNEQAQRATTPRGYSIAVRPAFRPIAASALTAIANAVSAPIPAALVALWSSPLDAVAEYDPALPAQQAFGRTLSFFTPSDAKQETLALRSRGDQLPPSLASAIAVGWVQRDAESVATRGVLVIEPNSGAVFLVGAERHSLVGDSLAIALERALDVGYWAGADRAGLDRYLEALTSVWPVTNAADSPWIASL